MMKKKFRLEYLFPNMPKEELENLKRTCFTYELSKDGEKEQIFAEAIQIHSKELFENIAIAKEEWQSKYIEEGSHILVQNPLYLPVYISRTAQIIITELLGLEKYFDLYTPGNRKSNYLLGKMHLAIFLSVIENLEKLGINLMELPINYAQFYYIGWDGYTILDQDNEQAEYLTNEVIEEIHDFNEGNERDLRRLKEFCNYRNIFEFLENIKKIVKEQERKKEALMPHPEKLDFENNKYFLQEIYKIFIYFNAMDPYDEQIERMLNGTNGILGEIEEYKALEKKYSNRPIGELVSITEYIEKIAEKLQQREKIAQHQVNVNSVRKILEKLRQVKYEEEKNNLINELNEWLKKLENTEEKKYEEILNEIKDFLNTEKIKNLNKEVNNLNKEVNNLKNKMIESIVNELEQTPIKSLREELIEEIKKWCQNTELNFENRAKIENVLNEEVENSEKTKIENMTPSEMEQEIKRLQKEIESLRLALQKKEQELEELKRIVLEFLEQGKRNSKITNRNLSNKEIRNLLDNYHSKHASNMLRKYILLMILGISLLGNTINLNRRVDKNIQKKNATSFSNPKEEEKNTNPMPTLPPSTPLQTPSTAPIVEIDENNLETIDFMKKNGFWLGTQIELENAYYYESITSESPKGMISGFGFISAYFPYQRTEKGIMYYNSLRSEEDLINFFLNHQDEIENINWKVAFTKAIYKEEIDKQLEENQVIKYQYTTCFVDYVPVLRNEMQRK